MQIEQCSFDLHKRNVFPVLCDGNINIRFVPKEMLEEEKTFENESVDICSFKGSLK